MNYNKVCWYCEGKKYIKRIDGTSAPCPYCKNR